MSAYTDEAEWTRSICRGYADRIAELDRENTALREAGHLAEKIIVQRTDEIRHLERENAALRAENETLRAAIDAARKEGGAP